MTEASAMAHKRTALPTGQSIVFKALSQQGLFVRRVEPQHLRRRADSADTRLAVHMHAMAQGIAPSPRQELKLAYCLSYSHSPSTALMASRVLVFLAAFPLKQLGLMAMSTELDDVSNVVVVKDPDVFRVFLASDKIWNASLFTCNH